MNLESLESLILGTSSAILLAPAVKKLTLAAAQGLSFLKRNQSSQTSDTTNTTAVHQTLAEVDQLLIELQSTLHSQTTPQHPDTISHANSEITEMVDSIHGLVDEVRDLAGPAGTIGEKKPGARQTVSTVLGSIAAFGGARRRARVFLSTTQHFTTSGQAYTIKIAGNKGSQQLTFASGISQTQMIGVFNAFARKTGVMAVQDKKTGYLIELLSLKRGGRFFVAARRISGGRNNLLYDESRSHPANLQVDFGEQ